MVIDNLALGESQTEAAFPFTRQQQKNFETVHFNICFHFWGDKVLEVESFSFSSKGFKHSLQDTVFKMVHSRLFEKVTQSIIIGFIHSSVMVLTLFSFSSILYLRKCNSFCFLIQYWNMRVIFSLALWLFLGKVKTVTILPWMLFPKNKTPPAFFISLRRKETLRTQPPVLPVYPIGVWSNPSLLPSSPPPRLSPHKRKSLLFSLTWKSPLWKTSWNHLLLKLNTYLPHGPVILFYDIGQQVHLSTKWQG